MWTGSPYPHTKPCPSCGQPMPLQNMVCHHCGQSGAVTPWRRNRTLAIVFAAFLGGIGAHKFYLGRPLAGVLYAAFCWAYIPFILAFFDMIGFLCMSDYAFDREYNPHLPPIQGAPPPPWAPAPVQPLQAPDDRQTTIVWAMVVILFVIVVIVLVIALTGQTGTS